MSEAVPFYARINSLKHDRGSLIGDNYHAIEKKYGKYINQPSLQSGGWKDFTITNGEGQYLNKAVTGLQPNKAYAKDYTPKAAYNYHLLDTAKNHAKKMLETPNGAELALPQYNDSKLRANIDAEEALLKKKEMFRKARNLGRVGLAGAGLYGVSRLFKKKDKNDTDGATKQGL